MLSYSLPEIIRVDTRSEEAAILQIMAELNAESGKFNYIDATKRVKGAYRGVHQLGVLTSVVGQTTAVSLAEGVPKKKKIGLKANLDVVRLAAPLAFNRSTQVFDLSQRYLAYGQNRIASYRVPFFFTEAKVVKLYFLQPRKSTQFSTDDFSLYASIVKKYLLDSEFYGERTDVEIVDVAEKIDGEGRVAKTYSLSDLEVWDDYKIERHLTTIRCALDYIEANNLVTKVRRPLKDKELPQFF